MRECAHNAGVDSMDEDVLKANDRVKEARARLAQVRACSCVRDGHPALWGELVDLEGDGGREPRVVEVWSFHFPFSVCI